MSLRWPGLCFAFAVLPALGQADSTFDPERVPPQIVVMVHKHRLGPDMVEVTAASATYPKALLESQAAAIARLSGSEARGLTTFVQGTDPKFKFVKATFAMDGMIDREGGRIRLDPLVKAFLGAPAPHTVTGLLVTFEGEKPVDKQTLKEYSEPEKDPVVALKARVATQPDAIEYRIAVRTQDPAAFTVPDRYVERTGPAETSKAVRPSGLPTGAIALVAVAALAGGALVYFLLAGRSSSARGRTAPRT
ncbi:MAG: hypothetical protein JST30_10875 [Armatimonadetes bacterium]|nr:hypothetical protein [Armatimonadota bacterium]